VSERLDAALHANLAEQPRPFRALYEHWERNQWSLFDLDFTVDAASYARLDEEAAHGLRWIFAHRFDAEFEVARLLPPFVVTAPDYDMQLVLATQLADEHRHLQAVLRVYDEVFGVRGFPQAQALAAQHVDPVSSRLYSEFERYLSPLSNGSSPDMFLAAVVAYHLLAEGVLARTAQNLAGDQYERFGEFPGLAHGQRLVARDEARHIGIGVSYVRRCAAADPEHTYEVVAEVVGYFANVAAEMLDTANASMSDLVVAGYGADPAEFYAEALRLLKLRMRSIGFRGLG
jgi:ribonucleotide reductase beta subunit family protein with ferritin-like domain